MRRVREEFEKGRQTEMEEMSRHNSEFLENLTFDAYAAAFAKIIADWLKPIWDHGQIEEGCDSLIEYILHSIYDPSFGIFKYDKDIRLVIRLACEVAPADTHVVQDITELGHSGYYKENEAVCEKETQCAHCRVPGKRAYNYPLLKGPQMQSSCKKHSHSFTHTFLRTTHSSTSMPRGPQVEQDTSSRS